MNGIVKPNWVSYFCFGSLAIIFSWALALTLTGCRLGNRVVEGQSPDPISGIYVTQLQTIQYCTTLSANTVCKNAPTNLLPPEIAQVMTDPIGLLVQDLSTGLSQILPTPISNGPSLPVIASLDGTLSGATDPTPSPYRNSLTCNLSSSFSESGTWTRNNGPFPSSITSRYPVAGNIKISFTVVNQFEGTCSTDLQNALNCFNDYNQCGKSNATDNQTEQSNVQSFFDSYIQAGVMTSADIPKVSALSYDVSYQ